MNLPNRLTMARFILAVPFVFLLQESTHETMGTTFRLISLAIFVIASLTDFFDGYIARKYNLITDFGKIMDPLADKILVISALVVFVQLDYIPAWMSIIVLAREFLISGIRILAAAKGEVIAAGNLGKYKTTSQMIVIIIALLIGPMSIQFFNRNFTIAEILMLIPVILTIWSGWEYTFNAKHYFMDSK
ncbi:CDP-diacylglycerol--glycerol-3-phosphate 3-phosphatidyltransferase [Fusobacterium russii]|uniref:CDP-diacylglycerol--glycerol-3-phosphate 3-phosphatidyltransferase n=1 Tax=Fusobacterium russii TaxID=854 RepID=UPI0003A6960E|nr:CDP-diacylglycerol--glycerol-3-phosphate 3-phosphatidyltransferase [Fusobacterium russii]